MIEIFTPVIHHLRVIFRRFEHQAPRLQSFEMTYYDGGYGSWCTHQESDQPIVLVEPAQFDETPVADRCRVCHAFFQDARRCNIGRFYLARERFWQRRLDRGFTQTPLMRLGSFLFGYDDVLGRTRRWAEAPQELLDAAFIHCEVRMNRGFPNNARGRATQNWLGRWIQCIDREQWRRSMRAAVLREDAS